MRMPFGKRGEKQKPVKKAAVKAEPSPPKAPRAVGTSSGVGVSETWIRVFERNEQVEETDRLTDPQISEHMKAEFPDLEAKIFDRVEIARSKYNRGGFQKKDRSGKVVRPTIHSKSHSGEAGSPATGRTPLPREGISRRGAVTRHHKDHKATKK